MSQLARIAERMRLTAPQKRHLLELYGNGTQVLYWRPVNGGEARCAHMLKAKGLLAGSFQSYSDGYRLTSEGVAVARALREESE